jgi:hypothetical protein
MIHLTLTSASAPSCRGKYHITSQLEVMSKDVKVVGLGGSASYQTTLGSVLNHLNVLDAINTFRYPPVKDILMCFEAVVHPGEMLRENISS